MKTINSIANIIIALVIIAGCTKSSSPTPPVVEPPLTPKDTFYFGADLSYVNQVLDHGGVYKDNGVVQTPYKVLKDHGATLARFRLWHNPVWTKDAYGAAGTQLYSDINDVEKGIRLAKEQGLAVELDLHFSDIWADPGHQQIPAAWLAIKDLRVLKDSVYNYTFKVLQYLNSKGLMPEMIQLGNESNCGFLYSNAPAGFPDLNACSGMWQNLGSVVNSAISAVRTAAASSAIKTKILLHVSEPKHVEWWFDNITSLGNVHDFDVIGFSYYPLWHTGVPLSALADNVARFKSRYNKKIMILETAYPWTVKYNDSYNNLFGSETPLTGYPYTPQGQLDLLKELTQQLINGGGSGIIYWEPAWISSNMKDPYGTGSAWENVTLFDFSGNTLPGIDFMKYAYKFK